MEQDYYASIVGQTGGLRVIHRVPHTKVEKPLDPKGGSYESLPNITQYFRKPALEGDVTCESHPRPAYIKLEQLFAAEPGEAQAIQ